MTTEKKREAWQTGAMIGCGMAMVVILLMFVLLVGGLVFARSSSEAVNHIPDHALS